RAEALDVLRICLDQPWEDFGIALAGGLCGMALNFAELAARTGESELRAAAWRAAELVADRLADDSGASVSGGRHPYAGLTRGRSGPALMFLRLYELSGDRTLLDRAATALRQHLRRC